MTASDMNYTTDDHDNADTSKKNHHHHHLYTNEVFDEEEANDQQQQQQQEDAPPAVTGTSTTSINTSSHHRRVEQYCDDDSANYDDEEEDEDDNEDHKDNEPQQPQEAANNNNNNNNNKGVKRRHSLELRKLPVNVLLTSQSECTDLHDDESYRGIKFIKHKHYNHRKSKSRGGSGDRVSDFSQDSTGSHSNANTSSFMLRSTCLNSKFSLRTQMMLSFGLVSAFSILLVVGVCIAVSIMSGNQVNEITQQSFDDLIQSKQGDTARYLAESLTLRILPLDLVQLMYEATQDRFAGYPLYEDDSQVPFFDMDSQTNIYPVRGPPLPLDWDMPNEGHGNVNEETAHEHVQHRFPWYQVGAPLSTASAVYFIQGMCDPNVTDPLANTYWPNCTQELHNNMTTGGSIAPSPTNYQIYRKAADLGPLLKTLYEFYLDVKELGIYFSNSGAGATVLFPHYQLNTSVSYESIGCNWLLDPHPLDDSRLIGSMEDHQRCELNGIHQRGKQVSTRLYNPMDRDWCRNQAQNPTKIVSYGPYQSAWHESEWLMSIGQAVYDRITQDFLGCINIDYVLTNVEAAVADSKVTANSASTIVRWSDEGTVVASSAWNMTLAARPVTVGELNVGMSHQSFGLLKALVDFASVWDPKQVRQAYADFHLIEDGFLVSAYPMPPPPEVYEADYHPEFFVVSSISIADIDREVKSVSESVDETVTGLIYLTLIVGCIGLGAVVVFIFLVSHAITLPLKYMNDVSSDIVNTFGSHKEEGIPMTHTTLDARCVPKTELSDVVRQFQKMVNRFSGGAMAKSMQVNVTEIENQFPMGRKFTDLYMSRNDPNFKYKFGNAAPLGNQLHNNYNYGNSDNESRTSSTGGGPARVHYGSVINDAEKSEATTFQPSDVKFGGTSLTSPLFFWILVLIVTPLLITTVTISAYVTYNISQGLFDIIGEAKNEYIFLETYALLIHTELRASYGSLTMRQSIRDLFLLTRYASWLLFGALERTESFPYVYSGVEECKLVEELSECEWVNKTSCDCSWNDRFDRLGVCENYSIDSRQMQRTKFFGLAEDIGPDGDRLKTSFPKVAYSPETTQWWSNVSEMPGSNKGAAASGYNTTYDRIRVASAIPFLQTLYNSDPKKRSFISNFVFFEADGLGIGYSGCDVDYLKLSEWVSDDGSSKLRPELCPVGKYGYDPRCRDWYEVGRKLALVNNTGLYVTPPYHFAGSGDFFGQTCTASLIDPRTNEHVGQTLVDFVSQAIFEALSKGNNTRLAPGGFPLVITGLTDSSGADTVIGPGFSLIDDSSIPVGDVVMPYDNPCPAPDCGHRVKFETIRQNMRNGERGISKFVRTTAEGSLQSVHVAFAPINAMVFVPVNSSDLSAGVHLSEYLVYSLALAEPEEGLLAPFAKVQDEIHKTVVFAIVVLAFVILFSTSFVIFISNRITLSMTEPMVYLLQLIQHINKMDVDGSAPCVEIDRSYGSREILNVVDTMETLYRIVQSANVAYFNGDVEKAYYVLSDAARLFKRLDNSKALGVANNNLGNTMLAFYRTMDETDVDEVCGFGKREVIGKGMGYYHSAIQLGEKAYDGFYEAEGWSPSCLEFMQHLSNRYFNRAMFLLTVKNGHERPSELEELGLRDLQISFDMDIEIVDQGTEVGWNVRGADKVFEVYLSRIRGHLLLLEMGYEDRWEVDETLDKAYSLVQKELHSDNPGASPLFREFCPAGRIQQIETELMRYKMLKSDVECAAKIAIRILVEDEMTLQEAQLKAVEVLLTYCRNCLNGENNINGSQTSVKLVRDLEEYRECLKNATDEYNKSRSAADEWAETQLPETLKKSIRKVISESESESMVEASQKAKMRLSSLRASTRGDVTMEVF